MIEGNKLPGKGAIRLAGTAMFLLGGSIGIIAVVQLFDFLGDSIDLNNIIKSVIICISGLLFAFVFMLSTPPLIRSIYKSVYNLEMKLSTYTSKDVTASIIGLVIGLLIAFLLTDLIKLIPLKAISTIIIIITYLTLALLGIRLGIKYVGEIIIINKNNDSFANLSRDDGIKYKILDSSVIIDGRILDLVRTGFLDGTFIVPKFIVAQLKNVSENSDLLKRNRGRRGLDILASLQREENLTIIISDIDYDNINDIDTKILKLAEQFSAKVITNDYNLNKIASVVNVQVLNINELSNAIKPVALPGEVMRINIVKQGKEHGQGIGFLEDGTMIVIENGGDFIGKTVDVTVTTALQTNAGRMIFTRIEQ